MPELIEAVVHDEESFEKLKVKATNLDLLSLVGKFVYPNDIIKHIADDIVDNTMMQLPLNSRNAHNNIIVFGSMGHLICGFNDEILTPLFADDRVAAALLPIFGQLRVCESEVALKIMLQAVSLLSPLITFFFSNY